MNALKIIFSRGYDFSWDIIGDGPYIGILKNECSNLKLASKVVFHGKINNDHSRDKILRNSSTYRFICSYFLLKRKTLVDKGFLITFLWED